MAKGKIILILSVFFSSLAQAKDAEVHFYSDFETQFSKTSLWSEVSLVGQEKYFVDESGKDFSKFDIYKGRINLEKLDNFERKVMDFLNKHSPHEYGSSIPIQDILGSFGQTWLYKKSIDGPNCFNAAFQFLNTGSSAFYMDGDEVFPEIERLALVKIGNFKQLNSNLKFGDLIVWQLQNDDNSVEISHAAIYVGSYKKGTKETKLIFQKSGPYPSSYIITDLSQANKAYSIQNFYKPIIYRLPL